MAWDTRYGRDSTGTKGADQPPLHGGELAAADFLRASNVERHNAQDRRHQ
jgi:hypothetical protein